MQYIFDEQLERLLAWRNSPIKLRSQGQNADAECWFVGVRVSQNSRFSGEQEGRMSISSLQQLMRLVEEESIDGVKLLENPNDNPICSLSYDDAMRCVTIIWRRYATSAQLRFVHEAVIQMLERHQANKILGDDSDLPIIHAEDQKWITEDWLPRAKAAGLKAAAAKVSSAFFGKVSIGSIQSRMAKEIAIKAFPNIHQARIWLRTFPE